MLGSCLVVVPGSMAHPARASQAACRSGLPWCGAPAYAGHVKSRLEAGRTMQARKNSRPGTAVPPSRPASMDRLRECIARLLRDAADFTSPAKVQETARSWLPRAEPGTALSDRDVLQVADALGMATDLALFTPSASGQTAFDRLARQRPGMGGDEAAALRVLRQAQFRLLRIEADPGSAGTVRLRDLATGEALRVLDEDLGPELAGLALVGRLAPLDDGRHLFVSGVTPLDDAGLAVATGFVRPGGRGPLPQRCAEAVYRHVVRHGTPEIPGLNRPPESWDEDGPEEVSELDQVALRWAEPGAARDLEDVQLVRTQSDLGAVMDMLASVANTRMHGVHALSDAYAEIVRVQLEALHRRHAAGSGTLGLDGVAAALEAEVAGGALPPSVRDVFEEARRRLGAAPPTSSARGADVDRLIGRIQALRAKTVEQGCTEQEALAAAAKVAELLDRYGLSLSELDLQRQACEGAAVETGRKRAGPVDDCVPAVAAFFDCRAWGEKGVAGTLRYVFFGLPADVVGARYLYDLVEQAFETETALFRAGPTYAATPTGLRRTATNSFGIGLGRGVAVKLRALRQAREAALRGASGRDLVVAKAGVVEAELAKLGLHLHARSRSAGRRVLQDVYEQGHEAGLGFEYTPGIGHER